MKQRFHYEYGAQPLHLIAVATSLLLSGYGLLRIDDLSNTGRIVIWIVAAALLHDLVAVPIYSLLLRLAHGATDRAITTRAMALHALNHVRVPAGLSLLLLLVYVAADLPLRARRVHGDHRIRRRPLPRRWLLISAAMFLISGLIYAVRLRRGIPEPGPLAPPVGVHRRRASGLAGLADRQRRGPRRDRAGDALGRGGARRRPDHQRPLNSASFGARFGTPPTATRARVETTVDRWPMRGRSRTGSGKRRTRRAGPPARPRRLRRRRPLRGRPGRRRLLAGVGDRVQAALRGPLSRPLLARPADRGVRARAGRGGPRARPGPASGRRPRRRRLPALPAGRAARFPGPRGCT